MSFYWHCSASIAISVPPVIKKGWWNLVSGFAKKSSPSQKPGTPSFTRQLTPSEIESLRQDKKEASAYARLFFEKKFSPKK